MSIKSLTIFCSSSNNLDPHYYNVSKDITKIIDEGFHKVGDIIKLLILRNNQKLEFKLELGDPEQNNKGL